MFSGDELHLQWKELEQRIRLASVFVLSTHQNPDADGIGSELALYSLLKRLGKEVYILNISPMPQNLKFMDPDNLCRRYIADEHRAILERADLLIALDAGSFSRIGRIGDDAVGAKLPIIAIDHHPREINNIYLQEIINDKACSVGKLLYEFISDVYPSYLDRDIAVFLYTAIAGDTGNFRFGNTTRESHRVASELMRFKIDAYAIYCNLFGNISRSGIKLLSDILQKIAFSTDGKIVWFVITREMMQENGAEDADTEGLTDFLRMISGVEVSIMFKERIDGSTRINFRSRGNVCTNGVARQFGGGGHKHASGIVSDMPLSKLMPLVLEAMAKEVKLIKYENTAC